MIILITGATHTGKTYLAQHILEYYKITYLSIDHLKMGLIRSGHTLLTPEDDEALVDYLWPILIEIIKTAIENQQNLVIEGSYIPVNWQDSFEKSYLDTIQYYCLVMTKKYIEAYFDSIQKHANCIEQRVDDTWYTEDLLIEENAKYLQVCEENKMKYFLIDKKYDLIEKFTLDFTTCKMYNRL